ncbi:hypothetical protein ACGFOU_23360 [Streptomyces sp. NPDC048595]|uniref:hypothetical protein n=1 Tax=Streptomyces sp. NPDC048595 TaxID=3365576 RepID=UPI0037249C86
MGKAMRMVAGALGAGVLVLSATGTASAKGWDGGFFDEDVHCAPTFSLLLPSDGCRTNILIDNHRTIAKLKQTAGGDIEDTLVSARRGTGGFGGLRGLVR